MRFFFKMERLEPIRGIDRSSSRVEFPRVDRSRCSWHFPHVLPELFRIRPLSHEICSPEHSRLSSEKLDTIQTQYRNCSCGRRPRPSRPQTLRLTCLQPTTEATAALFASC